MMHTISLSLKKKTKNNDDVIFTGVYTQQACSLMSGEHDFKAEASV